MNINCDRDAPYYGDWENMGIGDMGIGDWGLGIGDWPNPQSPIPNPQSPIPNIRYIFYS